MNDTGKLKGWKLLFYSLFLGPVFLGFYFKETGKDYPFAKYYTWASFFLMVICIYLLITFTAGPVVTQIIYWISFAVIFGSAFFYCWLVDAKNKVRIKTEKPVLSFSRAIAWMIVMGIVFQALSNISQAFYYWILGEQIAVYSSSQGNMFKFWGIIGFLYGFQYGLYVKNSYTDQSFPAVIKSLGLIFLFTFLFNGFLLLLIIYPRQRLTPISYQPQSMDFLFYALIFVAIALSAGYLLRTTHRQSYPGILVNLSGGILFISIHAIIGSGYATPLTLTVASVLEDRQELAKAKNLYEKSMPYIRYDELLASLHHRQGVLQALHQDYPAALLSFKRVLADYSEHYDVYERASKYVESYEKNSALSVPARKVLPVKHQTFEQSASCFPNSLSVILNFYEQDPVSTRKLSYTIKEDFSSGTFIWKAESFLSENGYRLITGFWQNKEVLISLLDAGFPVLLYVPGHVYTLYGYDEQMKMFFTYDTAKSNRWSDKSFWGLQKDWMQSGFLMSVVVPEQDQTTFMKRFPQFNHNREKYRLWQKTLISNHYNQESNYWIDYDPYDLSKTIGLDRLMIDDYYFLNETVFPFHWDEKKWRQDIAPVLDQSWAMDWSRMEDFFLYLIYSGQSGPALELIEKSQSRLAKDESDFYQQLMELKLAAVEKVGNAPEILSMSDKFIGITDGEDSDAYWGHYFKAGHLMDSGNLKGATELLIPILANIDLSNETPSSSILYIVEMLNEINHLEPSLFDPEKLSRLDVAQTYLGLSN